MGTNEDELTFKEGEIIQLISKVRLFSVFSESLNLFIEIFFSSLAFPLECKL